MTSPSLDQDLTTHRPHQPSWPLPGCPTPRPPTILIVAPDRVMVRDAPCGRWKCSYCRGINAWRLKQRLKGNAANRLLTLTWDTNRPETPNEAYHLMSKAFSLLVKILRRHLKGSHLAYVVVCEYTQAGYPHLHVLLESNYVRQRLISGIWKRLTGAPIVDIRRIYSSERTTNYLTKYLAKSPEAPYKCKHFRASKGNLPKYVPKHQLADGSPVIFAVRNQPADRVTRDLLFSGYILVSASDPWPYLELLEPPPSQETAGVVGAPT